MRLDLLAEGLYVRCRCMRVIALLVFPDLDDGELVRRCAALENFIANHAGILAAGSRELAQQRCIGGAGRRRHVQIGDHINGRVAGILGVGDGQESERQQSQGNERTPRNLHVFLPVVFCL